MKRGQAAMEALKAQVTGCLLPGDELVVAAPVALEGTAYITRQEKEKLTGIFSAGFLRQCISLQDDYGLSEEKGKTLWNIAREKGADAFFAMGEGGFLSALWKMAEASQVGLTVDLRKVPVRQETIEICEVFDLNPYKLQSQGAFLLGIRGAEELVQEIRNMGFMAEIIGQTNSGNDRLLFSNGNARYLERPAKDEIYKIKR